MSLSKWYKTVPSSDTLAQGDFLFDCPTIEVEEDFNYMSLSELDDAPAKVVTRDFIILSQSCDLEDENIDYVILCPVYPFELMTTFHSNSKRGELKSDRLPRFALLDKNDRASFPQDYFIVDLASAQSLPLAYVKRFKDARGKRLTLTSPYKEYLSQKFAYLHMRVGKPTSLTPFSITPTPA